MNMKVVVVWGFVVILFAGIGIFGLVNQDLLQDPDIYESPSVPIVDDAGKSYVCSLSRGNGSTSYRFSIDEANDTIKSINISYSINGADVDTFASATNINNTSINGITAALSGSSTEFALILNVTMGSIDTVAVGNASSDLSKLGIVIDNITDYQTYKTALTSSGAYVCD